MEVSKTLIEAIGKQNEAESELSAIEKPKLS